MSRFFLRFITKLTQQQYERYHCKFREETSTWKLTYRNVNLVSSLFNHLAKACKSACRPFLNMNALLMIGASSGTPMLLMAEGTLVHHSPVSSYRTECLFSVCPPFQCLSCTRKAKEQQLWKCTTLLSFLSCLSILLWHGRLSFVCMHACLLFCLEKSENTCSMCAERCWALVTWSAWNILDSVKGVMHDGGVVCCCALLPQPCGHKLLSRPEEAAHASKKAHQQ